MYRLIELREPVCPSSDPMTPVLVCASHSRLTPPFGPETVGLPPGENLAELTEPVWCLNGPVMFEALEIPGVAEIFVVATSFA